MSAPEPMAGPIVVAVDGPGGSGKSSVSKAVATALGYAYLDTGAVYRAFAIHARALGTDLDDPNAIERAIAHFDYGISTDPSQFSISVDAVDVTDDIRDPSVAAIVSKVARVPAVRTDLTRGFRALIAVTVQPGIVVEGRDITTVVAPDASVRILLTAHESVRAARRGLELGASDAAEVADALAARDQADARVVDFMTAADGVVTVDSTELNFEQTVAAMLAVVAEQGSLA
ncbi:MAG TPA: (d)CMP kinase [Candidatus Lumbricidophila sp.]|nr:(d)CMP kinase [Candidatus Lumbricidophila sp.]